MTQAQYRPADRDDGEPSELGVVVAEPTPEQISALSQAVRSGDRDGVVAVLDGLHPADAAAMLDQLPVDEVAAAAQTAPKALAGEVILELGDVARDAVLDALDTRRLAKILGKLDSDDAVYLVETIADERREQIVQALEPRQRRELKTALAFDAETAARLTQRDVVAAPEFWTVGEALDYFRRAPDDTLPDDFFELYIVDPGFRPVGAVALSALIRTPRSRLLREIMHAPPVSIAPQTDREDIAHVFDKYRLAQAPVVDANGRLEGVITIDDVVAVIQEENEEDLLALAGVGDAPGGGGAWSHFRARVPWLVLNLGTALAASAVIALFEATLERVVALAILMPIVAALGGNAGGQALAVAVRAIAARELTQSNAWRAVAREAVTALANGCVIAILLAVAAGLWFGLKIALVIGTAMLANFVCAGLAGILIPLALRRFGADPAVASSVFVTTLTDVVGFFLFLGLATLVLQ